jgi:hypothetical protein
MTPTETAKLLAIIQQLDNRELDKGRVAAWIPLMADVDFDEAQHAVIDHFRSSTDYLTPAHVVAGAKRLADYREARALESRESGRTGQHCGPQACKCTHTDGCDGGWIDQESGQVAPCPRCKPRAHQILTSGLPRPIAQRRLRDVQPDLPTYNPRGKPA